LAEGAKRICSSGFKSFAIERKEKAAVVLEAAGVAASGDPAAG
jgi:hypothetical protein